MMQQDQQKTQRRGQIPLQAGLNADPFSMVGKPLPTSLQSGTDLATIARNRVRPKAASPGEAAEFDMLTTPTPLQQRALDLLGVSLAL